MLGSLCRGVLSEMWGFGEDRPHRWRSGGCVTRKDADVVGVDGQATRFPPAGQHRVVRERDVEHLAAAVEGDPQPLMISPERLTGDPTGERTISGETKGVRTHRDGAVAQGRGEVPADEPGHERGRGM